MFIKIPFESVLDFKTNISEITKMSLEHDFNVNEGVVLGNFYISGEYRAHPVSINTDSFNFTLPFTVELRDDILLDTLEFNIEDFSYDVVDNNKLKVNIEYSLKAEVKNLEEDLANFERVDESELESELAYIDSFLDENDKEEDIKEQEELKNNEEEKGDTKNEEVKEDDGRVEEEVKEEKKEIDRNMEEEEKTVMDTIKDSDDTFVTYHIHIVSEEENMESICKKYNVSLSTIQDYNNNLDTISIGDKILIPEIDE